MLAAVSASLTLQRGLSHVTVKAGHRIRLGLLKPGVRLVGLSDPGTVRLRSRPIAGLCPLIREALSEPIPDT